MTLFSVGKCHKIPGEGTHMEATREEFTQEVDFSKTLEDIWNVRGVILGINSISKSSGMKGVLVSIAMELIRLSHGKAWMSAEQMASEPGSKQRNQKEPQQSGNRRPEVKCKLCI